MKYKPSKTLVKTAEVPTIVIIGANTLSKVSESFGLNIDLDTSLMACLLLYGVFKGLRNYMKNR
jgi:hypothetical protein